MYYCFSCGRGGGIIQYLQEYEGLSFDNAVEKACKLANTDISTMCYSPTVKLLKKIKRLKDVVAIIENNEIASDYSVKFRQLISPRD